MNKTITASWEQEGTLHKHSNSRKNGVYLFVFKSNPKRIIYVGTGFDRRNGFKARWNSHINLFKIGGRVIWKIENLDQDIYELMSCSEYDCIAYYKDLSFKNKFWNPNKYIDHKSVYNSYYDCKKFFDKDWQDYVLNKYLPKIELWSCELDKKEDGYLLETQLQKVIGIHFKIGFYCKSNQNWLGKQQGDIELARDINFKFSNVPYVDSESTNLIEDLYSYFHNICES